MSHCVWFKDLISEVQTCVRKHDQVLRFKMLAWTYIFWMMSRCPLLNTKYQIDIRKEQWYCHRSGCFPPNLSAETICWHYGTNSTPMWNNLIPLIMLEMLKKKHLVQGAEYGAHRNPCCSIWTPESICFPLVAVLILNLFSLLFVVSSTVSTRKHTA